MATEKIQKLEQTVKRVKRNTPEMEALLEAGYGMNKEDAERIIKERDKDPHTHPIEDYKNAKAFLAAYSTDAIPIDTEPGWKRSKAR